MKGYTQINVKKANMLYHRPANQNESNFSMSTKVHDTKLMLLVFLDLKNRDSSTDSILSHETVDCYLKKFTISVLSIHFKCVSYK